MIKRPFLLGLGLGIMAGAALLQLMLIGERATQRMEQPAGAAAETKIYSQDELDRRVAEERKRVLAQLERETPGKQQAAGQADAGPSAGKAENGQSGKAKPSKPDSGAKTEPSQGEQGTAAESVAAPKGAAKSTRVIVRIPPNASLNDAADLLEANRVVDDKQAFIHLMLKGSGKIRAGYFAFEGSPSMEQVAETVTGKPLPPEEAKAELNRGTAGK